MTTIVWLLHPNRRTWCVLRRAIPGGLVTTLCLDAVPYGPVTIATSTLDHSDHLRPTETCPACETELAAGTPGAACVVSRTTTPNLRGPINVEDLDGEAELGEWEER